MSPIPPNPSSHDTCVGVTVITGFLGSGKSTLIRRILTENHGLRLVVVENEFGASGSVEEAIVTQGVGLSALEQFIELPNGCICCAAQEDLTDSLSRLLQSRPGQIDHILIEASGLADPGPVAASFWVDEELETGLVLDAVVTVADAVNVEAYLRDGEGSSEKARITQKQLAVADLILLNKVDLVKKESSHQSEPGEKVEGRTVAGLEQMLRGAGCTAKIVPTVKCEVELSELLNIRAYDSNVSAQLLSNPMPSKFADHLHTKDSDVGSVTITFEGILFDHALLERTIAHMLWETEQNDSRKSNDGKRVCEIWRMKALVLVEGENVKRIYQSVDALFDHSESNIETTMSANGDSKSCFIFIGRSLREEDLRTVLMQAAKNY